MPKSTGLNKPEVVLIEYEDMAYSDASFAAKGARKYTPIVLLLVGLLVFEDDTRVVIATEWHDTEADDNVYTWRHVQAIPRVGIKSMARLEPKA